MGATARLGVAARLSRSRLAVAIGLVLACASLVVWSEIVVTGIRHGNFLFLKGNTNPFTDLYERFEDVAVFLHGGNLYALRHVLNNTNPPVDVFLYFPLRELGRGDGALAMTIVSLASLAVTFAVCCRRLFSWPAVWSFCASCLVLVPVALIVSEPLRAMLKAGQIRAFLLVLIVVDLLIVRAERRGYLTGLCAAIAITPLAFVVLIGLTAGRRAVVRCIGSFVVITLLGAFAGLHAFFRYWFVLVPSGQQTLRVLMPYARGTDPFANRGQASLRAILARPPFAHLPAKWACWAVVTIALALVTWWTIRRLVQLDLVVTATTILAIAVLVIEPITWNHYWVWALLCPFATVESWRTSKAVSLGALLVPLVCLPPAAHVMNEVGTHLRWPGAATGIYCVAGVAWIVVCALALRAKPIAARPSADESTEPTEPMVAAAS